MIHQYVSNGYHIVMDVNSGSVHVMDKAAYDAVPVVERLLSQGVEDSEQLALAVAKEASLEPSEAEETVEEILALKEAGQLFTEDIYENYIDAFQNRETVVKALCLHIAHDCNLACKYCFAGEGEYHGRRALMSLEVGKKALDFLVANSGNRVNLEVDFFGGEPLMNWQVVKDLVAYGRSLEEPHHKKFRFTLTTNGVLLDDEILEFANREMGNLVLSIDGRKKIHDLMRPHRGG
ncbi:MAG: radical SAM protein, partial [Lachnospiraceae bacterium]|nr:radical SAM protein [Lachnospiraceae bacterium]